MVAFDAGFGFVACGVGRAEGHAGHGGFDVQFAVGASPVVNTKGGVGGGLDFSDDDAGAECVAGTAGDVVAVAFLHRDLDEEWFDVGFFDGLPELLLGDTFFDAFVDDGIGLGVDDVPCFRFQMGIGMLLGVSFIGVDLDGEVLFGIEEFDEQGEVAFFVGGECPHELGFVVFNELAEGGAGEGAVGDDGHCA